MTSEEIIKMNIDNYTQKYATKHHISIEEAKKHIMVKIIDNYYKDGKNDYTLR